MTWVDYSSWRRPYFPALFTVIGVQTKLHHHLFASAGVTFADDVAAVRIHVLCHLRCFLTCLLTLHCLFESRPLVVPRFRRIQLLTGACEWRWTHVSTRAGRVKPSPDHTRLVGAAAIISIYFPFTRLSWYTRPRRALDLTNLIWVADRFALSRSHRSR